MVGKILFTSSSSPNLDRKEIHPNDQKKTSLLLLVFIFCVSLSCTPKLGWIRALPPEFPRDTNLQLGTFVRPTEKKSAMGSKNFQLVWSETIQIQTNQKFKKVWREWRVYHDHIRFRQLIGKGQYEKSNDWVLFSTKELNTKECRLDLSPKQKTKYLTNRIPCETFPLDETKEFDHNLVYYYDGDSLYPLQYESGYVEANFGIAWESDKAYEKTKLFEISKLKYGKKEFQPHVYHHVKLD
ncbi:MAG: hypothetical protein ACO1NV_00590 [Leptospira bouyouniensis]